MSAGLADGLGFIDQGFDCLQIKIARAARQDAHLVLTTAFLFSTHHLLLCQWFVHISDTDHTRMQAVDLPRAVPKRIHNISILPLNTV